MERQRLVQARLRYGRCEDALTEAPSQHSSPRANEHKSLKVAGHPETVFGEVLRQLIY
ncbi:MAG: hypothetical protein M1435_01830 [Actinobacteria bacterium]|jgi:hypothetical protein|nr:hypothetical protein [Actinomycetota bacterium]